MVWIADASVINAHQHLRFTAGISHRNNGVESFSLGLLGPSASLLTPCPRSGGEMGVTPTFHHQNWE
jgi:hypothetical protein